MSRPTSVQAARSQARTERESRRRGISYDTSTALNRAKLQARVERGAGKVRRLRAEAAAGDQGAVAELAHFEKSKAALEAYEQKEREKAAAEGGDT